jgi:hypothetical protein
LHPTLKFATLPLAMLSLACNGSATEVARGGDVTIAVQQALTGQTTSAGTFQMSGALTDTGATTEELTFGGPLTQSPVPVTFVRRMTGADGVLVLRGSATLTFSSQTAATLAGSWTVESASGKYASYTGSGTLTGAANFGATPPTATLSYSGAIRR